MRTGLLGWSGVTGSQLLLQAATLSVGLRLHDRQVLIRMLRAQKRGATNGSYAPNRPDRPNGPASQGRFTTCSPIASASSCCTLESCVTRPGSAPSPPTPTGSPTASNSRAPPPPAPSAACATSSACCAPTCSRGRESANRGRRRPSPHGRRHPPGATSPNWSARPSRPGERSNSPSLAAPRPSRPPTVPTTHRLVQEALANASKHAHAAPVTIWGGGGAPATTAEGPVSAEPATGRPDPDRVPGPPLPPTPLPKDTP